MKGWSSTGLRGSVGAISVLTALLLFVVTAIPLSASPLTISSVASGNVTDTSATITWTTDEAADSVVNYGNTTALGSTESDSALVTDHAIGLTNLAPATLYYYEVNSTNAGGNTTVDNNGGAYYTFTTAAPPDTTPPVISGVQATDITPTSATIIWTTDELATSVVNYGNTMALGLTASDASLVTSHMVLLGGLDPETTYYYEVQSTDGAGNPASDDNGGLYYTFITSDIHPPGTGGPGAPLTDGIVSVLIGMLLIWDKVLDGIVDLNAAEPLNAWGSANVRVSAEIAINVVELIARFVSRILLSAQLGGV
jgi:phosphodiesterase/alkaline phosphatase D-like protein